MPETRKQAIAHAKRVHIPTSQVTKATGTNHYYIAPRGVTKSNAKHAYAGCRDKGGKASTCAAVAHNLNKKR
jgi:hypothetical protein